MAAVEWAVKAYMRQAHARAAIPFRGSMSGARVTGPCQCGLMSHVKGGTALVRKQICALLAAAVFLALPAAVRAAGFDDTKSHWAEAAVDRMNAKALIRGSGGRFEPERAVTRYEAIVMIVRALGLEETAGTRTSIPPSFHDAAAVPAWARGYISVAVERGLITAEESKGFNGGAPASRLQVAAWLARALDLDEEASAAGAPPFSDTAAVSERYRGYITVLAERHLMAGAQGKFRPYDPLKRAEMATLLARVDRLLDNAIDRTEFRGTVEGTADGLTVVLSGGTRKTFSLSPDVRVYFEGKKAAPSSIIAGDLVAVITDASGRAAYIDILNEGFRVEGTVTAVEAGPPASVEVQKQDGQRERFTVAPDVLLLLDGRPAALRSLQPGWQVLLEGEYRRAGRIVATAPVEERRGYVAAITFQGTSAALAVRLDAGGGQTEDRTFSVSGTFAVTKDGAPARIYDVQENDRVTVKLRGGRLAGLEVESYRRTVKGTLQEVVFDTVYGQAPRLVIDIDLGGTAVRRATYPVAASAEIEKDGQRAGLTALRSGDVAAIGLTGDEITSVKAETRYSQLEGTLSRIILAEPNEIEVKLSSGQSKTFKLASDATVKIGQNFVAVSSLKPGTRVKLTVAYDMVTAIRALSQAWLDDIRGVVRYVDNQQNTIVLELPGGSPRHVKAGAGLLVIRAGQQHSRITALSVGDMAIIIGKDVPGEAFSATTVVVVGTSEE